MHVQTRCARFLVARLGARCPALGVDSVPGIGYPRPGSRYRVPDPPEVPTAPITRHSSLSFHTVRMKRPPEIQIRPAIRHSIPRHYPSLVTHPSPRPYPRKKTSVTKIHRGTRKGTDHRR